MAHEHDVSPNPWKDIARDLDHDHSPEGDSKAWNRASFNLNTHPLHPIPKLSQDDLLVPSAADRVRLFAGCFACGIGLALLWVYFPFMLVSIPLNAHPGHWLWGTLAVAAALMTAALFVYASAEERRVAESLL